MDGSKFVVAGSDPTVSFIIFIQFLKIKMYDEEKRVLEKRFNGEGAIIPGHSSRVFCVKFDKNC